MVSMKRQPGGPPPFRTLRGSKPRGATVELHAHDEAQLLFAASGTMQIYTETGAWLVPPQLAVWLPARLPHRIDVLADAECWMIYWQPAASRTWAPSASLDRAFALRVTPLLRELIFAAFEEDATPDKTELVVRLVLHALIETPDAPTFLPLPASAIGRRVADLALADPQRRLDVGELASRAATSVRTISRLFPAETGLTFKAWRQRARIVLAIDQLAKGGAISQVAARAGFASTAAFCFAFRQVTRVTPGSFLGHATHRGERGQLM
jgi:AraC-like DNA-binding protein